MQEYPFARPKAKKPKGDLVCYLHASQHKKRRRRVRALSCWREAAWFSLCL